MKEYGHFDDASREYVITDPATPWPWINYLGSEDFFSLISNTAGGYCFCKDAKFRRILRYRYNGVPMDSGGRYYYIREEENIWNPGWKPCKAELDSYECRHGMGYSRFSGVKNGLRTGAALPDQGLGKQWNVQGFGHGGGNNLGLVVTPAETAEPVQGHGYYGIYRSKLRGRCQFVPKYGRKEPPGRDVGVVFQRLWNTFVRVLIVIIQ